MLSEEARDFYYGNAKFEERTKTQHLDMLNDAYFINSIQKSSETHLKHKRSKAKTYHIK